MLRYACSPEAPDLWPSGATLAACSYRPCSVGCAVSPALGGCAVGLLLSLFGSCRVSSSGPPPRFGSSAFWNGFYVQAVRNEAAGRRGREDVRRRLRPLACVSARRCAGRARAARPRACGGSFPLVLLCSPRTCRRWSIRAHISASPVNARTRCMTHHAASILRAQSNRTCMPLLRVLVMSVLRIDVVAAGCGCGRVDGWRHYMWLCGASASSRSS